jgi:tetratricopeptide (TPR) repeat protein
MSLVAKLVGGKNPVESRREFMKDVTIDALALLGLKYLSSGVASAEEINSVDDLIKEADKLFMADKYKEAIPLYKKAISHSGKNMDKQKLAGLYFKIGFSYGELKEWDKGLEAYEKGASIHVDPTLIIRYKNDEARRHFDIGWANRKTNPDLAIKEFLKAQELEPDNPSGFYSIGWIFMRKKDYRSAIEYFKKAIKIKPDYRGIGALGKAYYLNHNWKESKFIYKAFLMIQPNNKYRELIIQRITKCEKHLNN